MPKMISQPMRCRLCSHVGIFEPNVVDATGYLETRLSGPHDCPTLGVYRSGVKTPQCYRDGHWQSDVMIEGRRATLIAAYPDIGCCTVRYDDGTVATMGVALTEPVMDSAT